MSERGDALARALEGVEVPGDGTRARTVVLDAFEAREPVPARRRRMGLRLALGVAVAALLAGVAVASPGTETIRRFVRDAVTRPAARTLPTAPMRLPGGGSLLVRSPLAAPAALFVVHADGSRRLLGPYRDGSWSPHARFVVATAGRHLVALDPRTGSVHWSLTASAPVHGGALVARTDRAALLPRRLPERWDAPDRRRRRLRAARARTRRHARGTRLAAG